MVVGEIVGEVVGGIMGGVVNGVVGGVAIEKDNYLATPSLPHKELTY